MQKNVLVVITNGFEDIETVAPIDLMRRAKINVTIAGLHSKELKGAREIQILTDILFAETSEDYDALIIPGGPQAEELATSEGLKTLLLKMNNTNKIIASICASPAVVLAPTGILDDKKATCFTGLENKFSKSTIFDPSEVVIDGNIITSRGAGTAYAFGLAIVEALTDKATRDQIARTTLFER